MLVPFSHHSTDDGPRHEAVNVTTGANPVPAAASTEALVSDKASLEEALALSVTATSDDTSAEQVVPDNTADDKAPEVPFKEQLAKLAELGFTDAAKNAQLLEKYEGDLPKTINDLVTINEWDPMMQELEEMVRNATQRGLSISPRKGFDFWMDCQKGCSVFLPSIVVQFWS
jgi:hypothetical protein